MNLLSDPLPLKYRVPQGSILGPVLFTIYVNDLLSVPTYCKSACYVDDSKVYLSFPSSGMFTAIHNLNADLEQVSRWCCQNSLLINPDKTKVLMIGTPQLLNKLVSLAWYWCYGGSYLFQKYLFLHSRSLNNICTVYPLSTLLASLPLFLFVLQYQNLKLAKSASKLLEKQIECKTHNTNKRYFIFISNLERSLFVLTPFSYKLKFQRTPMPSDAIYRV